MSSKTELSESHPWRDLALPWLTGVAMLAAIIFVFFLVPNEKVQGVAQRIFYFHVHLAWMAFGGFVFVAAASAWYLKTGSRRADQLALANAEVGLLFTTLVLVTGSLWARPIWGVWWTWDPRLTMTVVLWAIYAVSAALAKAMKRSNATLPCWGSSAYSTFPFSSWRFASGEASTLQ